jgi:glycosyltransferase involved in cell wall biosynthesis
MAPDLRGGPYEQVDPVTDYKTMTVSMDQAVKVSMLASKRERCGVADYTRDLLGILERFASVSHLAPPDFHDPVELNALLGRINRESELLHVQYHPDFFGSWRTPRLAWSFQSFLRRVRTPIILTVHDFFEPNGRADARQLSKRWINGFVASAINNTAPGQMLRHGFLRRANHVVVHSDMMRTTILSCGVDPARISVIYPGIPEFRNSGGISARSYGLSSDYKVACIFGFVRPGKGIEAVLDAVAKVPDVALLVAGGAPDERGLPYVQLLRDRCESLGISERVVITGYLETNEAFAALASADVVVLPYPGRLTSASYVLSYAAATRRPLIVSDNPYFREIKQLYDPFWMFQAGHSDELAAALRDVLRSGREKKGAETFRRENAWGVVASRTAAIYDSVSKAH